MKKKAIRHYAHLAYSMHHHYAKHLPKAFYHKGSLFSNVFWKSLFLLLVCSSLWYFLVHNLAPQTNDSVASDTQKMLFSLEGNPEDWGVDSASMNTHGAASNEFDFLFQTASGATSSSSSVVSDIPNTPLSTDWITSSSDISNDSLISSNSPSPQIYTDCVTPWWEKIKDQDFFLAYQQRTDVNSLCNVQKRYCSNGKLTWTYTQKSCKEDLKYEYTDVTTVAVNDPNKIDPFIQPSDPRLSGAVFDSHGKINTTLKATDTWSDSGKWVTVSTGPYVTHVRTLDTSSCTAPWWEDIANTHFVKAYKTAVWLIDMPCEVEIRYCSKGILKGSFKQPACIYKNMTYSDYLLGKPEDTSTPNVVDMMNTVWSSSTKVRTDVPTLWKWIRTYF